MAWTIALIGGVGGTLTVLCYGYWLREEGMTRREDLAACRLDLAMGYVMTAVFGVAMVIVGASIAVEGSGANLLVALSSRLESVLGSFGKWLFLAGTLGTVFSSLLGVWQAAPYLFADCYELLRHRGEAARRVDTRAAPYRGFLVALAVVPMLGLAVGFSEIQRVYAMIGAWFFPVLAAALLVMNGRRAWVGREFQNGILGSAALAVVLLFFAWMAYYGVEAS
jgi:Mn2+/Fe2+ NRAMP family transporter